MRIHYLENITIDIIKAILNQNLELPLESNCPCATLLMRKYIKKKTYQISYYFVVLSPPFSDFFTA